MSDLQFNSIDDIITILEQIIEESEKRNDPSGYFAALYQKVTIKVKEGIADGFFDDGPRMELLDVVFARRYIDAYFAYRENGQVSASWNRAFQISDQYWPIVLQHLLMGMNAHINFDLGIVAAEISKGKKIEALHSDFNKINDILASLVIEVQENLASIWPTLKKILSLTGKTDDFMIDFSMQLARDGAWKFACELADKPDNERTEFILKRDQKVAKKAEIITKPGLIPQILLGIIRLGEKGSVFDKIRKLKSISR